MTTKRDCERLVKKAKKHTLEKLAALDAKQKKLLGDLQELSRAGKMLVEYEYVAREERELIAIQCQRMLHC
jgi:hypothetical protein